VYVIEPDLDDMPGPDLDNGPGVLVDAHGMEPDTVFALLKALGGDIPKLVVVGCEPAEVSERMGLSPPVAGAVDQAVAVVRELIGEHESGEEG
jgi:hydrogenase maturation protease